MARKDPGWESQSVSGGKDKRPKIFLFGHFGAGNFGNESTLQAILYRIRDIVPNARITCICTMPELVAATYGISAVSITAAAEREREFRNPTIAFVIRHALRISREPFRWFKAMATLRGADMLIIPGTGLLTDAYGLFGWGPYNLFKWTIAAKLRGCNVSFVSVGAGPIFGAAGKWLIKGALTVADFRSYRDNSSMQQLKSSGFSGRSDRVYPDLVFGLPEDLLPQDEVPTGGRPVIALGVMLVEGRYSVDESAVYRAYLEMLASFIQWSLGRGWDIRLLIGDVADEQATQELRSLLRERSETYDERRLVDNAVTSVESLLTQLAKADVAVVTRFHNILFSILLNKPVISMSFHHKCVSLMRQMGLSEYCQSINSLDVDSLIGMFCELEKNKQSLKTLMRQRTDACRRDLDEQYDLVFQALEINGYVPECLNRLPQ
ncbi:polysaccharide pyruvyl transferase WcaK-like protein [Silvibacterium bohemicum]|uniref:Polysaccharide pyruvyl transferase WcaK-like protein n=1 Tax=Silvibacterium bohemicum TaxID=1577686 RepID=A0A841JY14_9BACT|nr:polysaccharide pyruvyl transferase family protein [Silvibacterium bohemicum]MBB6142864.1 polysaccharide pyruvyl transferase WcaK-like protein [Silvibacterium bohemicum]